MPPEAPTRYGRPAEADRPHGDSATAVLERPAVSAPPCPTYLQLEPSAVCDLDCRMCLAAYRRDTDAASSPFLALEDFRMLLSELPDLAVLHLQGLGEPFLNPQFLQMVREASDLGIRVATNTNMQQVHDRKALECIESGLDTLCISVDTPDPRTYELIRGGNLREVAENIRLFMKRRQDTGRKEPRVILVAVLMRSTLLHIPGLVRLAAMLGVDGVSVQNLAQRLTESDLPAHIDPLRRHVWQESLRSKDIPVANKVFAAAQSLADAARLELKLPSLRPKPPTRPACSWPWTAMYVTFSGDAVPCCMIGLPERMSLGNVFRSGALNVWTGPEMEAFRERLLEDHPPEVCLGCSIYRREF